MSNKTDPMNILTLKNPAFCAYLISTCLLVLKIGGVIGLTIYYRFTKKVFLAPEDVTFNKGEVATDEAVERTRRAHQNDLENITTFWIVGLAYLFVQPNKFLAFFVYFTFVLARFGHTFVYAVVVLPQPSRGICFMTGFVLNIYMALHTFIYVLAHL